jgi:hypothetical protein
MAGAYNVEVGSLVHSVLEWDAGRNDMFGLGLMALPERDAAARGRPERMVPAPQMGFGQ